MIKEIQLMDKVCILYKLKVIFCILFFYNNVLTLCIANDF